MDKIEEFKQKVIGSGIIDKEGIHHVFSQNLHGQKIDFDLIPDGSELFKEWVELTADFIRASYDTLPDAVIGVANGTNRLALAVAKELGGGTKGLVTVKPNGSRNRPVLTEESKQTIENSKPKFAVILEDVGTTGTNSSSVAKSVKAAGLDKLEVINTWQRSDGLPLLDELGIAHKSIINEILINYTAEECKKSGYCSKGWQLLDHGKTK